MLSKLATRKKNMSDGLTSGSKQSDGLTSGRKSDGLTLGSKPKKSAEMKKHFDRILNLAEESTWKR